MMKYDYFVEIITLNYIKRKIIKKKNISRQLYLSLLLSQISNMFSAINFFYVQYKVYSGCETNICAISRTIYVYLSNI